MIDLEEFDGGKFEPNTAGAKMNWQRNSAPKALADVMIGPRTMAMRKLNEGGVKG